MCFCWLVHCECIRYACTITTHNFVQVHAMLQLRMYLTTKPYTNGGDCLTFCFENQFFSAHFAFFSLLCHSKSYSALFFGRFLVCANTCTFHFNLLSKPTVTKKDKFFLTFVNTHWYTFIYRFRVSMREMVS